jgi:spoIIIJ-associated protein
MTSNDSIEITAPTIDDAINEALGKLGAAEDDVVIEVLSTPRSGVLGLGSRAARVRVTRRSAEGAYAEAQSPPPTSRALTSKRSPDAEHAAENGDEEAIRDRRPAELEEQTREATSMLAQILDLMGEKAEVRAAAGDNEAITLDIKGDGSGILIGRHGQTLDALEYLLNRIVARKIRDALPLVLDTESYRERRYHRLERIALAMGERAKREHAKQVLEPMSPRDRRIIHMTLKDDPMVTTRSTGEGYMRSVEILPTEARHERSGRSTKRERESEPIGQQGGFERGQKKIV